jgi:hypothetical protein
MGEDDMPKLVTALRRLDLVRATQPNGRSRLGGT